MAEVESTPTIELSSTLQEKALSTANNFLSSPDAASIRVENFMSSNIENQTILKTIDESSNTAFHVETGFAAGSLDTNSRKTVISWFTLGEDKGDLQSGSIEILESGGEKKIFAYKVDDPLSTDEGYLWGGSRDVVDRTIDMQASGAQIPMTEEQASEILARLESSKANKEYTEATAQIIDVENRFLEELVEFQSVKSSNRISKMLRYPSARKRIVEAAVRCEEVENEINKKMKKRKNEEDIEESPTDK